MPTPTDDIPLPQKHKSFSQNSCYRSFSFTFLLKKKNLYRLFGTIFSQNPIFRKPTIICTKFLDFGEGIVIMMSQEPGCRSQTLWIWALYWLSKNTFSNHRYQNKHHTDGKEDGLRRRDRETEKRKDRRSVRHRQAGMTVRQTDRQPREHTDSLTDRK